MNSFQNIVKKVCGKIFESEKNKMTFLVVSAVLLLAVILLVVYLLIGSGFGASSRVSAFGLENIGELATQSGYFTEVNVIEDSKQLFNHNIPFTSSKYIFSYDGIIKAGIDFAQIEWNVDEATKTVHVKLPPAKVLSREFLEDSLEIYDERQSVFTPLSLSDIQTSRQEMLKSIEESATKNGLLEQAGENAKLLVTGFLSASFNPNEYSYVFE